MLKIITKHTNSKIIVLSVLVSVSLVLSGCSLLQGPAPQRTKIEEPVPVKQEAPKYKENGTAQENLEYFKYILKGLADSQIPVKRESIKEHMKNSGFVDPKIEITPDRTPAGDASPQYFVGVHVGAECLLGQIVIDGKEVKASAVPAIGPKKDTCVVQNPKNGTN